MNFLRLSLILCLAALFAQEPKPASAGNRWLLVVDASQSMARRAEFTRNVAQELVLSGFQGQARPGDTLGAWAYGEQFRAGQFPLQTWAPEQKQYIASRVGEFLGAQTFDKKSNLAAALEEILGVVADSKVITVILISDGEEPVRGTPFDDAINAVYREHSREMRKLNIPFVTVLQGRDSKLAAYTVTDPFTRVKIPAVPEPTPQSAPPLVVKKTEPPPKQPAPAVQAATPPKRPGPAPVVQKAPQAAPPVTQATPEPQDPPPLPLNPDQPARSAPIGVPPPAIAEVVEPAVTAPPVKLAAPERKPIEPIVPQTGPIEAPEISVAEQPKPTPTQPLISEPARPTPAPIQTNPRLRPQPIPPAQTPVVTPAAPTTTPPVVASTPPVVTPPAFSTTAPPPATAATNAVQPPVQTAVTPQPVTPLNTKWLLIVIGVLLLLALVLTIIILRRSRYSSQPSLITHSMGAPRGTFNGPDRRDQRGV